MLNSFNCTVLRPRSKPRTITSRVELLLPLRSDSSGGRHRSPPRSVPQRGPACPRRPPQRRKLGRDCHNHNSIDRFKFPPFLEDTTRGWTCMPTTVGARHDCVCVSESPSSFRDTSLSTCHHHDPVVAGRTTSG